MFGGCGKACVNYSLGCGRAALVAVRPFWLRYTPDTAGWLAGDEKNLRIIGEIYINILYIT